MPGPTVLLVVSYALGHGRRASMATVAGVALGDLVAMTGSMLGLGALLATSAAVFERAALDRRGVPGLARDQAVARAGGMAAAETAEVSRPRMLLHAFAVTALNPKSIVFFIAFVPQFLDTTRPLAPQMAIMVATFVTLAAANAFGYAMLAAGARRFIRQPATQHTINRLGGCVPDRGGLARGDAQESIRAGAVGPLHPHTQPAAATARLAITSTRCAR